MRLELLYVADIVEAADAIALLSWPGSQTKTPSTRTIYGRAQILQKLIVIGEAASHLSAAFREQYADVEWADIVACP